MIRLVPCCSTCGSTIENDADGPCCPGATIAMVQTWPAAFVLGVTRPPVLGTDADLERLGLIEVRRAS